MARKKSVTPAPEEQELMEQPAGLPDPTVDDNAAEECAAPGEEDMALMEQEYGAATEDGDASPENGADTHAGEDTAVGDFPDAGEQPDEGQEAFPPDDPFPDGSPEGTAYAGEGFTEDDFSDDGQPGGEDEASEDYDALLQELGAAEMPDRGEAPLPGDAEDSGYGGDDLLLLSEDGGTVEDGEIPEEVSSVDAAADPQPPTPAPRRKVRPSAAAIAAARRRERVLTIDAREDIQTDEDRDAIIWHHIQNSHRTRRILTGTLDGVEKTDSGLTLAVVNYKGFRVAIPLREMLLEAEDDSRKTYYAPEYQEQVERLNRILNARLGSEIDFIVKGCDKKTRSVVGSRKEAMYRKRQAFYLNTNELGEHMIYEGRVVQARVVAVAEKIIRVEVFGVETSIVARDLSWEWLGNARDHFHVGDRILVRVLEVDRSNMKDLSIKVDVRSVSATNSHDNLKKCMPQCRYAGRVTDVRNGVVYIRLNNGVNAIAHSCYDSRYPGKKDDVSFAVTRLDGERNVAIGIITRIIKQNL